MVDSGVLSLLCVMVSKTEQHLYSTLFILEGPEGPRSPPKTRVSSPIETFHSPFTLLVRDVSLYHKAVSCSAKAVSRSHRAVSRSHRAV